MIIRYSKRLLVKTFWMVKKMFADEKYKLVRRIRECCLEGLSTIVNNRTVILFGGPSHSQLMKNFFSCAGASNVLGVETEMCNEISLYNNTINKCLAEPNQELLSRIKELDSGRGAIIYAGSAPSVQWIDGRRIIGSRMPDWALLEKKQEQARLLSGQDGYRVSFVNIREDSFRILSDICYEYYPCVLAGELVNGIEMGSNRAFIINDKTKDLQIGIFDKLREDCEGVRVANFTDGLPVTVYGFCDENGEVYCYPPVIGIVGYCVNDGHISAPGIIALRTQTVDEQSVYKSVIDTCCYVSKQYNFLGAFGVDGAYKDGQYIIHDFNTRICSGFSLITKYSANEIPQNIIDILLREHVPIAAELMSLMADFMSQIHYEDDAIVWQDNVLSSKLTDMIRNADTWQDKVLVSHLALKQMSPLFDFVQ